MPSELEVRLKNWPPFQAIAQHPKIQSLQQSFSRALRYIRYIRTVCDLPFFSRILLAAWMMSAFVIIFYYSARIATLGWNSMEFIITNHLWQSGRYATGVGDPTAIWRPLFPTLVLAVIDRFLTDPVVTYRIVASLSISLFVGSAYYIGRFLGGGILANIGALIALLSPALSVTLLNLHVS